MDVVVAARALLSVEVWVCLSLKWSSWVHIDAYEWCRWCWLPARVAEKASRCLVPTLTHSCGMAALFLQVLDQSVTRLNFKAIVDGLGDVLFK